MLNKLSEKEKGYIIGLFIGDGYSNYHKNSRHYRVNFYLNSKKDKDVINKITYTLEKIGLNVYFYKDKRSNTGIVRVSSKNFMNTMENEVNNIDSLGDTSEEFKIGLLSGFIDAEGYVNNGEIQLTQKDKNTLLLFKKIADEFDISRKFWSAKNYKGSGSIWRFRVSTKFKYLPHNSCKVRRQYST